MSTVAIEHGNEQNEEEVEQATDRQEIDKIIQFKIVYWGPGESGKTTNFQRLKERFFNVKLTDGFSIETTDGRTLWQDSLFISFDFQLGNLLLEIITQIVTCTGQERFLSTREYIIDGADGIIFVGVSDPEKMEQNKRSFRELITFARPKNIPYVIQLNKRDLSKAVDVLTFKKQLGLPKDEKYPDGMPVLYPTIAAGGRNVIQCYQDLVLQVIFNYFK